MEKVRIVLVDDHQMLRDALRSLLEKTPNFEVVGETGDPFAVIALVRKTLPHIVCMDIGMPGMNGIETTRQLIAAFPSVKVIVLSSYSDQRYVMDMMSAGASAYVTKAEAVDELLRAISAVRQNRKYLCPDVTAAAAGAMNGQSSSVLPSKLGNRERQVLQLVAEGHTSSAIAERLNIATSTVEVHRRNIMRKLNMHSVADLTRYAMSSGLIAH
ncbi:MAG: response regulator transcription factor [Gallionellaceae bacterium]|nr:response regulator transcription factor [Gallionellaceae bacterium]